MPRRKTHIHGSGTLTSHGYVALGARKEYEHRAVVERILGKSLPVGAEIHHVDGNGQNNCPTNLVVCPNHSYHLLLHARQQALAECGHVGWRKCRFCHDYADPLTMKETQDGRRYYHTECQREHNAAEHRKRQELRARTDRAKVRR